MTPFSDNGKLPLYGLLNLQKEAGWTSHDCVARLRRLLGTQKIGHGGTLDPAATGVLPMAVGQATRLLQYLPTAKAYRGRVRLGLTTTTDDLEGEVIDRAETQRITQAQVEALLPQFVGEIVQVPPRYSAIQVQGQRLYDLARQGEAFEVPARQVSIQSIALLDWQPGRAGEGAELELAIACGPGTYIRSIARDLGQALGVGGCLASLVRTESCGLTLADSLTLAEVEQQQGAGSLALIDPLRALQHLPQITLPPAEVQRWQQGQRLPLEQPPGPEPRRVQDEAGKLLGIGLLQTGNHGVTVLSPKLVLPGGR